MDKSEIAYWELYMDKVCSDLSKYHILSRLSGGGFGDVYKAKDKEHGKHVALKRIRYETGNDGLPTSVLPEVKILSKLYHENVIRFIEPCRKPSTESDISSFFMVYELCQHDLAGLISKAGRDLALGEMKTILIQILKGLKYIHSMNILHLDIKPANILVTKDGLLKIADFGISRELDPERRTQILPRSAITLPYRPAEIILGERCYGTEVDMWSFGCLMAELWKQSPLFPGRNEQHQLNKISSMCGSITSKSFPGVEKLSHYEVYKLKQNRIRKIKKPFGKTEGDRLAGDLVDLILQLDPAKRLTASEALNHEFFIREPAPRSLIPFLKGIKGSLFGYAEIVES